LTLGNDSVHHVSSDNGVRIVNSATTKNLVAYSREKLVRLIKMFEWNLNRAPIGKHLSDMFPIKKGLKQGEAWSPLFSTLL
jgi:hypothetical protein